MAYHVDPVATTTYRKDYKVDQFLPAIRMTTLPMFMPGREVCTNQWRPSLKKVPQPPSTLVVSRGEPRDLKKRVHILPDRPKAERPKSGRRRILNTKFGAMDMSEINRLAHVLRWTPTTKVSTEETHIPLPKTDTRLKTLEPKADMIKFNVRRYEDKPRLWQQADLFDRYQVRQPVERVVYPYDQGRENKLLPKRGKAVSEPPYADKIRSLLQSDSIPSTYIRQRPGYAGYVPQLPPKDHTCKPTAINPGMLSTMKATYREFPPEEYALRQFARLGPFSKTVTLTYPFNPFNKVEEDTECI